MSRTFGALATKVVCVDADQVPDASSGLEGYAWAHVLVRLAGEPVGVVRVPVEGDVCPGRSVVAAIDAELGSALARVRLLAALERPPADRAFDPGALAASRPQPGGSPVSTVTVAVCTRDRADQLERCLAALARQRLATQVLVVDNAPSDDATARLLAARFPDVERVVEPRPGLDHARNRAVATATTEVVAFTDDDVVVDPGWTWAIARAFDEEPDLGLLTGLVLPLELETPAQHAVRALRRVRPRRDAAVGRTRPVTPGRCSGRASSARAPTWPCGGRRSSASVASTRRSTSARRRAVAAISSCSHRALAYGELVRYEPAAIVFHRHRATLDELAGQLRGNGATLAMMQAALRAGTGVDRRRRTGPGLVRRTQLAASPRRGRARPATGCPSGCRLRRCPAWPPPRPARTYRRSQQVNGSLAARPVERATVRTDEIAVSTVDLAGPIEPPTDGGRRRT